MSAGTPMGHITVPVCRRAFVGRHAFVGSHFHRFRFRHGRFRYYHLGWWYALPWWIGSYSYYDYWADLAASGKELVYGLLLGAWVLRSRRELSSSWRLPLFRSVLPLGRRPTATWFSGWSTPFLLRLNEKNPTVPLPRMKWVNSSASRTRANLISPMTSTSNRC